MTWSIQFIFYSYSVFVVWKDIPNNKKKRMIIDIRELNKITETDIYLLSLQFEIITLLLKYSYLSIIDAIEWFHQFLVARCDKHKFTMINHRGQEKSVVVFMKYKGFSLYIQRQIDTMLKPFKKFAKAFVDDIIVFFHTLSKHFNYLRQIFGLFRKKRVNLSPIKFFIDYPSIVLLNQQIDDLEIFTTQKKIWTIINLRFPKIFRDLEIFLDFTEWFRSSISRYAQLANSL